MKHTSRVCVLAISIILLTSSLSYAQEKIRTVEKDPSYPNQPIELVSREVGDKPFMDDAKVLGDQDWLKQLKLGIKNVSNKSIISFEIHLWIKKEGKMLTGVSFPVSFRTRTKTTVDNVRTPQGEKKGGMLLPGEVVKVRVSDRDMLVFSEYLKKYDAEDVERIKFEIRFVYFDDGSSWGYGQESRPDPENPGERIRIDKPEPQFIHRFSEWMKSFFTTNSDPFRERS